MSLMKELREFAVKGNMIDMAVGIIIGGAFGKIVSSLVGDIFMPVLGMLVGGVDFTSLAWVMKAAEGENPAVLLNYGMFLQTLFDFIIVAIALFIVIKGINALRRKQEAAPATPPAPPEDVTLLREIRDLLRKS